MKLRQFYIALISVFLSILLLSMIWELWAEDIVISFLFPNDYEPESLYERIEYIITISTFSFLSLIIPGLLGRAAIIKQKELQDEVARHAEEDYLTGIHNRRKITSVLQDEVNRAKRYQKTFSIILIDIDHFKQTNDTYGHHAGDKLIIEIANIIKQTIRLADIAGRWGGEEFLVLCPETGLAGTSLLAEKMRNKIETTNFGEIGQKTASFGVTTFESNENIESIIQRADTALYSAKRAGRNRVEVTNPGQGL